MGHNDKSSTGTPPESCNAGKRAGGIFDAFRLGENQGGKPLFLHQPGGAVPVEITRHRVSLTWS